MEPKSRYVNVWWVGAKDTIWAQSKCRRRRCLSRVSAHHFTLLLIVVVVVSSGPGGMAGSIGYPLRLSGTSTAIYIYCKDMSPLT